MPADRAPRPRPLPTPAALEAAERRFTEAIAEVHLAARSLALPRVRFDWEHPPPDEADAEQTAFLNATAAHFAELQSAAAGPFPDELTALSAPPDPDSYLVNDFIRPGTTVMLTGPPGAAKSWAARQLALACGAGLDSFLDRYTIPRPLNVLVIDEDNGIREEWRREELLLATLGLQRDWMTTVRRISLAGVQLDQERWQVWLRGLVRIYSLDLLILDPISEMHGGKELREDPAFRSVLGFLKRLKVDFSRLSTLLVHHTRKPSNGDRTAARSVDDVRGQWGQTPDVVALMWPLGERRSSWELHKRVPHSKLILEQAETGALHTVADETTSTSRAMANDGLVLNAIRGGLTTFTAIQEITKISKSTLDGVLKRLVAARVVERRGREYSVVDE